MTAGSLVGRGFRRLAGPVVILGEVEEYLCRGASFAFRRWAFSLVNRGFGRDIQPPGTRTPLAAEKHLARKRPSLATNKRTDLMLEKAPVAFRNHALVSSAVQRAGSEKRCDRWLNSTKLCSSAAWQQSSPMVTATFFQCRPNWKSSERTGTNLAPNSRKSTLIRMTGTVRYPALHLNCRSSTCGRSGSSTPSI